MKRRPRIRIRMREVRALLREANYNLNGMRAIIGGYKAAVYEKTADGWKRVTK